MQINTNEPVAWSAAATTALVTTFNVLALIFGWGEEVVAGVNLAIGAWVALAAIVVRSAVTPTTRVALTVDDVTLIDAGKAGG